MHCFQFLFWLKFCSVLESFSFGVQKKWSLVTLDRWLSYVVMIVWEVAWVDSALVGLDKWLSYSLLFFFQTAKSNLDKKSICILDPAPFSRKI